MATTTPKNTRTDIRWAVADAGKTAIVHPVDVDGELARIDDLISARHRYTEAIREMLPIARRAEMALEVERWMGLLADYETELELLEDERFEEIERLVDAGHVVYSSGALDNPAAEESRERWFAGRPTELRYDHLAAGDEGYWPVLGAVVDDIRVGDRISEEGDTHGEIVTHVDRSQWPWRLRYTNADGEQRAVGSMAKIFVDRWGTAARISPRVR